MKIQTVVKTEVDLLKADIQQIKKSVDSLTSSVDGVWETVERRNQRLFVFGAHVTASHVPQ